MAANFLVLLSRMTELYPGQDPAYDYAYFDDWYWWHAFDSPTDMDESKPSVLTYMIRGVQKDYWGATALTANQTNNHGIYKIGNVAKTHAASDWYTETVILRGNVWASPGSGIFGSSESDNGTIFGNNIIEFGVERNWSFENGQLQNENPAIAASDLDHILIDNVVLWYQTAPPTIQPVFPAWFGRFRRSPTLPAGGAQGAGESRQLPTQLIREPPTERK